MSPCKASFSAEVHFHALSFARVFLDGHDVPLLRSGYLFDRLVHRFGPAGRSRIAFVATVVVHGGEAVVVFGNRTPSVIHVCHLHLVDAHGFQNAGQMLHGIFRKTVPDEENAQFRVAARASSARVSDLVGDIRKSRLVRPLFPQVVGLLGIGIGVENGSIGVVGSDLAAGRTVGPLCHGVVIPPEYTSIGAVGQDRTVVGAVLEGRVACRRRDAAAAGTGRRGEIAVVRTSDHRRPCAHVAGDVTQTSRHRFSDKCSAACRDLRSWPVGYSGWPLRRCPRCVLSRR